ncbi:MAG: hypothetical protein AABX51_09255 [Nanoarchaeota archaeon]
MKISFSSIPWLKRSLLIGIFSILVVLSNVQLVQAQSYELIMTFPESGVDSEENFGETFAPCRSSGNCSFSCNAANVGRTCSNLVCAGGSGDSAYFYTHDYACVYYPPACTPDPSCAADTCTTDTCYDSCSNAYAGTKSCPVACTVSNVCGDTAIGMLIGAVCSATPPPAVDQCPLDPGVQCSASECSSCIPDSSCSVNTCTGSTCYDACGNSYGGSKFCGGCVADSSCAASTCTGSSCSDSCGNTYGGTLFCGGCVADPSCAASTCTGDTCTDSCSNSYPGILDCSVPSLKICENSCSSGLQRSGSSFAMATGSTRNLVSCWNTAPDCSVGSGNVTSSTSWSESGGATISLSGTNPKVVTANSAGSENVTATYSGNSASTTASVGCVPSVTCATAPEGLNHCPADMYTVGDGCGNTLACSGRRACDFNWKEVAP